jgi:hypothetical protein
MQTLPYTKILAVIGGAGLTAVATYMNADAIASSEGWLSPLTIGTIILTISGAIALPLAEQAYKTGQWLKAAFLVLFFSLVVIGSLLNTLARTAAYRDSQVATGQQANANARLASEAYAAAQATVADECKKRGDRCRAAEAAVVTARNALATVAPAKSADPAAARLSALLGISERAVALYVPLILPTALELGGFILLAFGFAPRAREIAQNSGADFLDCAISKIASPAEEPASAMQIIAKAAAMPAKAGTKAYYLQRLQRDFPAFAEKIASGDMSVYAASIAAGLRKAPAKASKWTKADAYMQRIHA